VLRSVHKIVGVLAGVATIVGAFMAFKTGTKPLIKVLLLIAVLTTFAAGVSGKAAVGGKGSYSANFNKMRGLAVVSVLLSVGALASIGTKPTKTTPTETKED
jgi:hypothetical protein